MTETGTKTRHIEVARDHDPDLVHRMIDMTKMPGAGIGATVAPIAAIVVTIQIIGN